MVPNRGAAAPCGASCNAQGCRELIRFLLYHWKDIFKMSPKLNPNCYGFATRCRKLYFCFVGCRKHKKVGNHCARLLIHGYYKNFTWWGSKRCISFCEVCETWNESSKTWNEGCKTWNKTMNETWCKNWLRVWHKHLPWKRRFLPRRTVRVKEWLQSCSNQSKIIIMLFWYLIHILHQRNWYSQCHFLQIELTIYHTFITRNFYLNV